MGSPNLYKIELYYLFLGESLSDSRSYGWETPENTKHDWEKMVAAIQDHIRSLNWGYKVQLRQQNVKYYNKYASLVDKHTLKLVDKKGVEETCLLYTSPSPRDS